MDAWFSTQIENPATAITLFRCAVLPPHSAHIKVFTDRLTFPILALKGF